ncbi:MAG: hypothetical protein COV67_06850 [Nitrospinae bacterium CG11_big_fil_rev_8_21_14_0_20_56_8]|nr:MAG: hypothetical protein COV67_06850 [Nitrospinae bacterium CG11_big_fil_rev_8_21_14_0_20_56_8]
MLATPDGSLTAVIAVENDGRRLSSCLHSVRWVPRIVLIFSDAQEAERHQSRFPGHVVVCREAGTPLAHPWSAGMKHVHTSFGLLLRSNEVVTGKLRRTLLECIGVPCAGPARFALPRTTVFLKKRLKYPLIGSGTLPSCLAHIPEGSDAGSVPRFPETPFAFEGELIHYAEETIEDCMRRVTELAGNHAERLHRERPSLAWPTLARRSFSAGFRSFFKTWIGQRAFKEGFEGCVFCAVEVFAAALGPLKYYEQFVRSGKPGSVHRDTFKNILVIKLRDIGDNILCTPLISNLKQSFPHASLSVLSWSYSLPVFENHPALDRLFGLSKQPDPGEIDRLLSELNGIGFDLVLNTHGGKLSTDLLQKIHTRFRLNNHYRGRNKNYDLMVEESDYYRSSIERDLDCLRALGLKPFDTRTGIFLREEEIAWARETLERNGFDPQKKIVLIHPTAAVDIREWPIERFGLVIEKLDGRPEIQSLAICTEAEYPKVKPLLDFSPGLKIFHQMTVRQMMALIHECHLVLDNDSSPSHVATAFGIPTIVLFSQAIREVFRPYSEERDRHFVFYKDVDCRECELVHCGNRVCLDFTADEVFAKTIEMLGLRS